MVTKTQIRRGLETVFIVFYVVTFIILAYLTTERDDSESFWGNLGIGGIFIIFLFLTPILLGTYFLVRYLIERTEKKVKAIQNSEIQLAKYKEAMKENIKESKHVHRQLQLLKPSNLIKLEGRNIRYRIEFNNESSYNYLTHITLSYRNAEDIKISGIISDQFPFSLSLKQLKGKKKDKNSLFNLPEINQFYKVYSSHVKLAESILQQKRVHDSFIKLKNQIQFLTVDGHFFSASIYNLEILPEILNIFLEFYKILEDYNFKDSTVEKLLCYKCETAFESDEENCHKCNAPRPKCIICMMDLKPSEKEMVVQTPCCEVFVHKNHILIWLEKTFSCPNCGNNLALWNRDLRKNRIKVHN